MGTPGRDEKKKSFPSLCRHGGRPSKTKVLVATVVSKGGGGGSWRVEVEGDKERKPGAT